MSDAVISSKEIASGRNLMGMEILASDQVEPDWQTGGHPIHDTSWEPGPFPL